MLVDVDDAAVGYPRVLVFARGGHFVHRSHKDVVASAVVRLMDHVTRDTCVTSSTSHRDVQDQTYTILTKPILSRL